MTANSEKAPENFVRAQVAQLARVVTAKGPEAREAPAAPVISAETPENSAAALPADLEKAHGRMVFAGAMMNLRAENSAALTWVKMSFAITATTPA